MAFFHVCVMRLFLLTHRNNFFSVFFKYMKSIAFLDIPPLDAVGGCVRVPGSKSISNRALLLAGLSQGATVLYGVLDSDDTQVMLEALKQLGCSIEFLHDGEVARGVRIQGVNLEHLRRLKNVALFLGNAGTVMRPLAAVLALTGGCFQLSGVARMHERPIGDLVDALRQLGCQIDYLGAQGFPPLRINPMHRHEDGLRQPIAIKGNVSSQFLSALLLALPLVSQEPIVIEVAGELISKPYIAITLKLLSDFGVQIENQDFQRFIIPAGSSYHSPTTYTVEGDASSASYFIAAGALAATPENPLLIKGVGAKSIQGDIRFIQAAQAMGAYVHAELDQLRVHRNAWPLHAIDLDCNHMPDAAMTLGVMALFADGTSRLRNIASWRVKETDRLNAMHTELTKLGAQVHLGEDFIEITPPQKWQAAEIETYDDHRIAMCFSLAAFNPAGLPVRLLDPACVNKTYPGYFDDFFQVAHTATEKIPVLAVDGPTASGKGTLASMLAQQLGYHYLDSGSLYRVTALAAMNEQISLDDATAVAKLAYTLPVSFQQGRVLYRGDDVGDTLRAEKVGMAASKIAAYPLVREALTALQQSFRKLPGLVADGRDMGTVVFPDAQLKVFLTAKPEARARRRYNQLKEKGVFVKMESLLVDLQARDAQDIGRAISPLQAAQGAYLLDNSDLNAQKCVENVLSKWTSLQHFE